MKEEKIPYEKTETILTFLSHLELFKSMKPTALKDLVNSMMLVSVHGNEMFIRQGEQDQTLYILLQGRLAVLKTDPSRARGEMQRVAEISVGQIVGEMSLLTNQARTGSVIALRDSLLLKLGVEKFQKFEKDHPFEVIEIAKIALQRLIAKPRSVQPGENIITITVAPAGDTNHKVFVQNLVSRLDKLKPTLFINSKVCDKHFNKKIAQIKIDDPEHHVITTWLQSLESQYSYIVYETDRQMTPWTQRCLRQADHVLFVADDSIDPSPNSIEMSLFADPDQAIPFCELVFIHPDDKTKVAGSLEWLAIRRVTGHHHLRMSSDADWGRFIRLFTAQSLGVVLSGGGARGLGHCGVLKAMEKLGIPIDFIAGSSMGSLVAASYALLGMEKSIEFAVDFAHSRYMDYTFPIVSLLKGKCVYDYLHFYLGDTNIEDLWTRFFCVSTNLSSAKLVIHDRGPILPAVRASISIPGIFPPFYSAQGDILVDGGILNNLPVDIMRSMLGGGKILAISCNLNINGEEKKMVLSDKKPWVSGWGLLFQQLNPLCKPEELPDNIFNLIMSSMTLSSVEHQRQWEQQVDYLLQYDTRQFNLMDFASAADIIEVGYRETMEKLPAILGLEKKFD